MNFNIDENAQEFEEKIEGILLENEDVFSLFFGVLQGIKAGNYENPFMATIEEDGKVLAIFQMTPPHPLNFIFVDEARTDKIIECFIRNILARNIEVHSIISLKPWAYQLVQKWESTTGLKGRLRTDQGIYRINQTNETLTHSPGTWRFAEEKDCSLIETWYKQFEKEAGMSVSSAEDVTQRIASFVKMGEVFLWEDKGRVVSMMKRARQTKNGITVSLVFTPEEERKKGYARTLVTFASRELLKQFKFCVLYTDMMNPTANKIYQEIGYKKIADSVHLDFVKEE